MKYTIQKTSNAFGVSTDTLRYYDEIEVLSPKRGDNGYRYYDENDFMKLEQIALLKYAGFSLNDIGKITNSHFLETSEECNTMNYNLFVERRDELRIKAEHYKKMAELIDTLLPMINSPENAKNNMGKIESYVHELYVEIVLDKGE